MTKTESKYPLPEITTLDGQTVDTLDWATVSPPYDKSVSYRSNAIVEVLLADGRVVYVDRYYGIECDKFYESPGSVGAHWKQHSPTIKLRRAEAELAKLHAKQEQQQNRRNGQLNITKRRADTSDPDVPTNAALSLKQFNAVKKLIATIKIDVAVAKSNLTNIESELTQLSADLDKLPLGATHIDVTRLSADERLVLLRKLVG